MSVGVSHARWNAGYDIRIDMQNPTQLAKVVYKASISQATGEVRPKNSLVFPVQLIQSHHRYGRMYRSRSRPRTQRSVWIYLSFHLGTCPSRILLVLALALAGVGWVW